jgi:RNA ligase
MTEKKANHQANIVRITEIKEHTNADTLVIISIGGYQVVSKKGQFNIGDLGVYIQPDSVVPQTEPFRFIWGEYASPVMDPLGVWVEVPEKRRRITVRKFRKEWSEGLLLPVSDFWKLITAEEKKTLKLSEEHEWVLQEGAGYWSLLEGDDVSDILGITHYDSDTESTKGENSNAPKRKAKRYPRSFKGWAKFIWRRVKQFFGIGAVTDGVADNIGLGIPTYDVDAYKARPADFVEGEPVRISEKIHGSNARFIFLDGVMYAGSRNLWKAPSSNCIFRSAVRELPWIEEWCRAHEGYVLWGEVTPTQKGFDYGSKDVQFFVFDVYTPQGDWLNESTPEGLEILTHLQDRTVPVLYKGPYQGYNHVKTFVDGPSTIRGANHIREGVVVATTNRANRSQRKIVSNVFLEKDSK